MLGNTTLPRKGRRSTRHKGLVDIFVLFVIAMATLKSTYAFSFGLWRVMLVNPPTRRGTSSLLGNGGSWFVDMAVRSRMMPPSVSGRSCNRLFGTDAEDVSGLQAGSPDEPLQLEEEYSSDDPFTLRLAVPTPEDMEDVGAVLSIGTGGGDTILLGGDLGAGKTCLSRGFVRTRTGDPDMRVTSPTYLLSNSYPADGGEVIIYHMDLYRLKGGEDLEPLDMDNVVKNGICLIEWPSRLGEDLPPDRLDVTFRIHDGEDFKDEDEESKTRFLTLRAHSGRWEERLKALEDEGYLDDLLVD